ncbi:transcription factor RF2a-like [Pyrus ussuriensis x Pyrus communis]|uniref:Transcription factor RF2a-like n=1 Tax=Pyrus ussuriensis x Pyrus communis TaxID=2448454 RepID=A0A5N5FHV0_9ROSA|nr:transcription factor RF2a-like [Pyrus ussuriensis x Pyrus communis]
MILSSQSPAPKKRPAAVLEEVAQRDPKLAKRIMTNRRSAMRAKERKKMYIQTLEYNIQRLQFELAALTAQLEQWQIDTLYITAENSRLKECLHHILEDIELQDVDDNLVKELLAHGQK